ncbi:TIGR02117 family protein [Sinorhizobium sp. CCBAU 05631]|uniref:TIGR02117 family protein n=1 Tax=Sinorhizobium sp. CCBAU 05631 TaxID=794846 RepID=UPI00055DA7E8|nr:TIGR02117 family protein [Sinorhizobium sp. CCBAU 05631]
MKRAVRWLCGTILVLMLAAVGGTLVPKPLMPAYASGDTTGLHRILVLSGPIHTDIAVRVDDEVRAKFAFLEDADVPLRHPDAQWLIFGWGGRSFYLETPTWSALKPLPVLRALSLDRSVMHVDTAGHIVEPQDAVAGFDIDAEDHQRLLDFIDDSFRREAGVAMPVAGFSYGPNDRFFEAHGYFNALFGCNTWTARALRNAGLRTGLWNPIPVSLDFSLSIYN